MKVLLLEYTPNPDYVCAIAAKQCYNAGFIADNLDFSEHEIEAFLNKLTSMGHESPLEHACFTFAIEGISRACSHQLVRFRVASFSQQSQRYCFMGRHFDYNTPPSILKSGHLTAEYNSLMRQIGELYNRLVSQDIPAEDARFVLPNACTTNIIMTMNARELLHAFRLRCCTHAQWEIRELFNGILDLVKPVAPSIFAKAGPSCINKGACPEGERSCNRGKD